MAKNKATLDLIEPSDRVFCIGEMISGDEETRLRALIPLNPKADIDALKKGDTEPVDLIMRTSFRENKRGWIYDDSAFVDVVTAILTAKILIPNYLGHQSQEALDYEFRDIVGSCVGALKEGDYVYYRIVIDQDAKKLKRWIRNNQVGEVSIWGFPTTSTQNGVVHVIGYQLISVDFTPPGRAGQDTEPVSIGEMDQSFEQTKEAIRGALRAKYPDYTWIEETFDSYIIASHEDKYYRISYLSNESGISLGDAVTVRRVVSYEIIPKEEESMEMKDVSNDALLAELRSRSSDGRLAPAKVAGEMSFSLEKPEQAAAVAELAKIKAAAGEMDPIAAIEAGKKAKSDAEEAQKKTVLGEMVKAVKLEKGVTKADGSPAGEMEKWVDKLATFKLGMTRDQVAGEMDRVIGDADVKAAIAAKCEQAKAPQTGAAPVAAVIEV